MRLRTVLVAALGALLPFAASQAEEQQTYKYESDISRLRSLVIHSLYSHKDVFLRELLSNANDALEKLRITALTDRQVMSSGEANVTIEVKIDEDSGGKTGKIIVRDTGIGMTKDELAKNLGTIARSGTGEFLKKAEEKGGADGNLIGQFGLGFYSCFLVSNTVRVSSLPPPTAQNPNPEQYTFVSTSSGDEFQVFPDPRGNTLGRGTEIVLNIEEEEKEWLSVFKLKSLIDKHSTFSTTFPIYILERSTKDIPVAPKTPTGDGPDELEDDLDTDDQSEKDVKTKYEWVSEWVRVNDKAPLWMRDPAEVKDQEYQDFYKGVSKDDSAETLGWAHFKGDTGSGVSYRAIMYIPAQLPKDFWQKIASGLNNVRLMVKRVFITDDMGDEFMPRWLSFLKVTVDADDLPLNVSRETLQNHRFLKQLQRILVRKAIDLFTRLSMESEEKYQEVSKLYGNALRIGMLESDKDKVKIAKLLRFESTRTNCTSLEEYVDNRKEGQKQIYFMAGVGEQANDLARSPFVEKLHARGYEVLLLNLPSDEPMMGALDMFMGMKTQDVSKKGLKYGDEDEDAAERKELNAQNIAFGPLLNWLKRELKSQVSDVVLTNRLVTSPCTIIVDSMGWSANMQRIMAAQAEAENDPMYDMMKKLPKVLEINPKSPLIEGMLERVLDMDDGEVDEKELQEAVRVLFDTTLVRSGFSVPDPASYFDRVESMLRRSIGVSQSAKGSADVRPAPPIAHGPLGEEGVDAEDEEEEEVPEEEDFLDWHALKEQFSHDEL